MKLRVVVLGAGFGGLELSSILSEELGDDLTLTLIDKNDSFRFRLFKTGYHVRTQASGCGAHCLP